MRRKEGEGSLIRGPRRFDDFDINAMEDAKRRRDYRVMRSGETENAMRAAGMTGIAGRLVRPRLGCRGDKARNPAPRHGLVLVARNHRAQSTRPARQRRRRRARQSAVATSRLRPMPSLIKDLIICRPQSPTSIIGSRQIKSQRTAAARLGLSPGVAFTSLRRLSGRAPDGCDDRRG